VLLGQLPALWRMQILLEADSHHWQAALTEQALHVFNCGQGSAVAQFVVAFAAGQTCIGTQPAAVGFVSHQTQFVELGLLSAVQVEQFCCCWQVKIGSWAQSEKLVSTHNEALRHASAVPVPHQVQPGVVVHEPHEVWTKQDGGGAEAQLVVAVELGTALQVALVVQRVLAPIVHQLQLVEADVATVARQALQFVEEKQ